MDVLAILSDAMHRNDELARHNGEVFYDLDNKHIIRSIYEHYEKPFMAGEQCAVILDSESCEVVGFFFYNSEAETEFDGEREYLDESPEIAARYKYIYAIICRELVCGRNI